VRDEHVDLAEFKEGRRLLRPNVVNVQDSLFGHVCGPAGRQIIKDIDLVAGIEEWVCNMGPYEAGGADD
jgi:hypothetical protein